VRRFCFRNFANKNATTTKRCRGQSNEHSLHVWFQLAYWFRRRFKWKNLLKTDNEDGHKVMITAHLTLGAGSGELKRQLLIDFSKLKNKRFKIANRIFSNCSIKHFISIYF
jgi:hypothetical protein